MTTVQVFDPAMCCATGVCGPQVDPRLATFESDLRWLGTQGAQVSRHNLGQAPGAFAESDVVRTILASGGEEALPVILVDGRVRWTGQYPTRDELAAATIGAPVAEAGCDSAEQACCTPAQPSQTSGSCC